MFLKQHWGWLYDYDGASEMFLFEAAQLGDSDNLASERSIFHLEIHSHFPSARRTGGRFKKYFQDILTDLI